VIVLVCSAAVGATFVLEQVHTLRDALSQNRALSLPSGTLAPAGWGDPQTLLLVGDDQRALTRYYHHAVLPHSNEMLLVRIDPSKPYISMMSIPRELEATIYPSGQAPITTRFNYAYTAGGIPLLVSTIKRVLGLSVNHVMVITFARFKRAVNEMGCVYSTIDRRYYHVNVPGGEQYQEIDLQPGYQDLCGAQALEFVSYRHGDTSLVRDARDQSLLLDVKKQYGPTLAANIGTFERIFGQAVQTDRGLESTSGLLNLIGTLISSAGRRVRQVRFQANLVPASATPCACVTASAQQIAASVHAFVHGGSSQPTQSTAAVARAVQRHTAVARLPLVATGSAELAQARAAGAGMPFPYEYPRMQHRGANAAPASLRDYVIHAPDGSAYPIYVAVFSAGQLGQFYDVQGTTWTSPPQLDSPGQTVRVGGRTYDLYYDSQHLKLVAWNEHGAAYWIHNTLTDAIPNGELLAIAEQTHPVTAAGAGTTSGSGQPRMTLKAIAIPTHANASSTTNLEQTLGSLAGLLTLVTVPLLAVVLIKRRRELSALRAQLHTSLHLEAQLSSTLATSAIAPPATASSSHVQSTMNVYTSTRLRPRRPTLVAMGLAAVAAAGVLAVLLTSDGGHTPAVPRATVRNQADIPAVPAVVLNATSTKGAAGLLARQLRTDGVTIAAVGNLTEARPPGVWILYAPGQRDQALRVARLLARRTPRIAPIDPVTRTAAGSTAKVIVLTA